MIETGQLQTLLAVARAGSFSRAAEGLHVTQSAISQSVKNLETRVGTKLFTRSGKQVVLTHEGEKLYELAEEFFLKLDDTLHEIDENTHGVRGRVRIGSLSGIGKSWLSSMLIDLLATYPDLKLGLTLGLPASLTQDFKNLKLDGLVVPKYAVPSVGEKIYIGPEKTTLVYPKNGNFDVDENLTIEKLSSLPILLFEEDDYLLFLWCRLVFGSTPRKLHRRFVVNSHGNILQAVSKGLGVAVVPTHVLERSFYRDKVGVLSGKFEVHTDDFYFVYHKENDGLERMKVVKQKFIELSETRKES
ncbi:MAG: LysR family transcriptional regulator [Bacteriovoracaceae bacterium]|jgi:DNA-binding transcriptional LysR family regulator|nr:LysR family transcriptional regulator [Bacteriovoracaceae bacterium]